MKFNTFLNGQHYVINTSTGNHTLNLSPLVRLNLEVGSTYFPTWAAVTSSGYPTRSSWTEMPYNCDGWSRFTINSNYVTNCQTSSIDTLYLSDGDYPTYTFYFHDSGVEFDPYMVTNWDNATTGLFSVCGPAEWDSNIILYFTLESVHKYDEIYWSTEKNAFRSNLNLDEAYIQGNFNYILKFKLVRREEYGEVIIPSYVDSTAGYYVNPGNTVELYFGAHSWDDISATTSHTMTYLGCHEIYEGDEYWSPVSSGFILDPYAATLMISYLSY